MHGPVSSTVPAFLSKLWSMVNEDGTDPVIGWTEDGKAFYLRNHSTFSMELLPIFYKHNNIASFVRQLNMYGFRKIMMPMSGSLRNESDEMVFAHPDFVKGHPEHLDNIKRKISSSVTKDKLKLAGAEGGTELLARLYGDVKTMKSKQEAVNTHLDKMKRENEALWREVLVLRQKHAKQQQIVNKLIQFLVSFVQPSARAGGSIGLKRKHQLPMLEDSLSELAAKQPRLNRTFSVEDAAAALDSSLATAGTSPDGPVIHELIDTVAGSGSGSGRSVSEPATTQPSPAYVMEFTAGSPSISDGGGASAFAAVPERAAAASPAGVVTSPPSAGVASVASVASVLTDHQYMPASPPQDPLEISPADREEEQRPRKQQSTSSDTTVALHNSDIEVTPVLCDTLLESIQADLDGLRGLIGGSNWHASPVHNILQESDIPAPGGSGDAAPLPPFAAAADQQVITYNPSLLDLFASDGDDAALFPDLAGLSGGEEGDEGDGARAAPALPPGLAALQAAAAPAPRRDHSTSSSASGSGLNTPVVEFRSSPKFPTVAARAKLISPNSIKKEPPQLTSSLYEDVDRPILSPSAELPPGGPAAGPVYTFVPPSSSTTASSSSCSANGKSQTKRRL